MRIISPKFHDFYDKAMAEGQDRSLVFIREPQEFVRAGEDKTLPPALRQFVELGWAQTPGNLSLSHLKDYWSFEVRYGLIWFAGKLYPVAEVSRRSRELLASVETTYCHHREELQALLASSGYNPDENGNRGGRWARWRAQSVNDETFFALAASDKLMELALAHSIAVATWSRGQDILHVNQKLANLHFFKRLDAWQAFQELSMFFGNIAAPDRTPVVIEDKYRIAQHGFDKWSFRKPPETARTKS